MLADPSSTMSRRGFLGTMSASALAGLLPPGDSAATGDPHIGAPSRIRCAVVRRPRALWLGSPGAAYDLDGDRRRCEAALAEAAAPLGVQVLPEAGLLQTEDAVGAFIARLESDPPDAVLINLQHLGAWNWADRIAGARLPTVILAPLGAAAIRRLQRISRRPGVHIVSSLDPCVVEDALVFLHPCERRVDAPPRCRPAGTSPLPVGENPPRSPWKPDFSVFVDRIGSN